jgi:ABC-type amino acid transport substrate-binding protein
MKSLLRSLSAVVLAVVCAGCDMPRDPEGTYQRVQGGTLRAGLTLHEPWTRWEDDQPAGIEVELLKQFAEQSDARLEWVRNSESRLLEQLEGGRLDVVIGGLKDDSPWSKRVGLTRPFLTLQGDGHVMAVRQGENRWLLELDKFLQGHRGVAMQLYRREIEP